MYAHQNQTGPAFPAEIALVGNCGYQIEDGRVVINIDRIANNRTLDNCSGTLSVELWALTQTYGGGPFDGIAVAGTRIGELYGDHFLSDCCYDLLFQEPPAGVWHMTLMLREWRDGGYVTRDYVSFVVPYQANIKPAILRNDNVINVDFSKNERSTPAAKAAEQTGLDKENARPQEVADKGAAGDRQSDPTPEKPAAAEGVSLNQASVKEIAGVKGISRKLAENIVAKRPFESPDELLKVKGMGAKLLEKVRPFITL